MTNNAVNDVASYTTAFETQPAFVEFIVQNVLKSKKEDCPMLVKVRILFSNNIIYVSMYVCMYVCMYVKT